MEDPHIAKFLEIAAAVIPVLWLAVAVELRTADFLKSGRLSAHPSRQRAWAQGIVLLMVASGLADISAFSGLLGASSPVQAGFVAVVLYLLIGLVILLSL